MRRTVIFKLLCIVATIVHDLNTLKYFNAFRQYIIVKNTIIRFIESGLRNRIGIIIKIQMAW